MRSANRPLRRSSLRAAALSIAVMLPVSAGAGSVKPPPAIESLVLAERAFARASIESGIREAFLAYLAEDAVIFRPGPVAGRAWIEKLPPVAGRLSWEPLFADVSRAGDMGYTTGPWQFLPAGGDAAEPETAYGHYVSIWTRGTDDAWRVIVDLGNNHARPEGTMADLRYPPRSGGSGNRRAGPENDPGRDLLLADGRYAELAASDGTAGACGKWASDEIRVYRSNRLPAAGKARACADLRGTEEHAASQRIGSGLARTGDLGYVFGNLEFMPQGGEIPDGEVELSAGASSTGRPEGPGSFLRIWKSDPHGAWRLVLDISVLHPPVTEERAEPPGGGS